MPWRAARVNGAQGALPGRPFDQRLDEDYPRTRRWFPLRPGSKPRIIVRSPNQDVHLLIELCQRRVDRDLHARVRGAEGDVVFAMTR